MTDERENGETVGYVRMTEKTGGVDCPFVCGKMYSAIQVYLHKAQQEGLIIVCGKRAKWAKGQNGPMSD